MVWMMATSSEPKQIAPRSYVTARQNAVHVPVSPSAPLGNHQPAAAPETVTTLMLRKTCTLQKKKQSRMKYASVSVWSLALRLSRWK